MELSVDFPSLGMGSVNTYLYSSVMEKRNRVRVQLGD